MNKRNKKLNEHDYCLKQAFLYSIESHCYANKMNKAIIARDFANANSFASLADNAVMRTRQYLNALDELAREKEKREKEKRERAKARREKAKRERESAKRENAKI